MPKRLRAFLAKPCGNGLVDYLTSADAGPGFMLPIHIGAQAALTMPSAILPGLGSSKVTSLSLGPSRL